MRNDVSNDWARDPHPMRHNQGFRFDPVFVLKPITVYLFGICQESRDKSNSVIPSLQRYLALTNTVRVIPS